MPSSTCSTSRTSTAIRRGTTGTASSRRCEPTAPPIADIDLSSHKATFLDDVAIGGDGPVVHVVQHGAMTTLISNVTGPADLGVDTKRRVIAVPRFNDGKVEYFKLP